jgi:hypothetical protein
MRGSLRAERPEDRKGSTESPFALWFWLVYAALLTFAHRALCAAAIRLRPAAEIVRFGFALCFAQRAFCARLILRRPAADIVRDAPFELTLPRAASAASMRWSCFCTCSRSFFNCWTTTFKWFIGTPAEIIAESDRPHPALGADLHESEGIM